MKDYRHSKNNIQLFAVIIPTIGRSTVLNTINSVLNQTFQDFTIIVVLDSCSFFEKELLNHFNTDKIQIVHNYRKNGGNGARNSGILSSNSPYVCFLDDDDIWHSRRLEIANEQLMQLPSDYGGCYTGFEYWNGIKLQIFNVLKEKDLSREILLNDYNFGNSSNLIFKRDALEHVGLWEENLKRHQDYEYILRFLRYYKLKAINSILLRINGHSTRPDSLTMLKTKEEYIKCIQDSLSKLSLEEKNFFYYKQYKEIYMQLSGEGKAIISIVYYNKARQYKNELFSKENMFYYLKIILAPFLYIRWALYKRYGIVCLFKKAHRERYLKIPI